uniref:Amino acid ABC transporter permease n=1 Tax=Polynucleobacter necessarius subsp. necessarius (strain STIR1) TaxID=452638 RepID=B1XSW5_POLNS
MLSLDLSFYNWELFTNYILKGLLFSVQLTVIATVGGIVVGLLGLDATLW